VRQEVTAQQVSVYLAQDRPAAAKLALEAQGFSFEGRVSWPAFPPGEGIAPSFGRMCNAGLRLLGYLADAGDRNARLACGVELAGRLLVKAFHSQQLLVAMETLLVRAQMQRALGNLPASRADTTRTLQLAEPGGFIAVFVEQGGPAAQCLSDLLAQNLPEGVTPGYLRRILEAFAALRPSSTVPAGQGARLETGQDSLIEPLTGREREVLGCMAEGLKYKEIAARLYITHNTVRFHVKAIYAKLSVNNRTRAIAAARELHLL